MNKVLFICTSNKDRSPALETYFRVHYPEKCLYKSAGINEYYCKNYGTSHLRQTEINWSDLIVFAEDVHHTIAKEKFDLNGKRIIVLNLGHYNTEQMYDYVIKAEQILKELL